MRLTVIPEHQCFCWSCHPEWFPKLPDDPGAKYIALYAPERRPVPTWSTIGSMYAAVIFNGNEVGRLEESGMGVTEALEGNGGYIVWQAVHPSPPFPYPIPVSCPCGGGWHCQQVSYGAVEVRFADSLFATNLGAIADPEHAVMRAAAILRATRWEQLRGRQFFGALEE